ncbi:MAG TPA: hypothetical protein PKE47_16425, partial [Verrucomicrobiota bacterium]|nr:hypothetical protein [Verrucomicrobiota bacterium]
MNFNRSFLAPVLGALLLAGVAAPATVIVDPPASATEYIAGQIGVPLPSGPGPDGSPRYSTLDPLPSDVDSRPDFARFVFPNKFDLEHPKELSFRGTMQFAPDHEGPLTALVGVTFDWFDPRPDPNTGDPVGWANSAPFQVMIMGSNPVTVVVPPGGDPFLIDFCPPQVSIEFFFIEAHPGTVVAYAGDFTHTCIPEPATTAAAFGMALAGFALWRRQRSR